MQIKFRKRQLVVIGTMVLLYLVIISISFVFDSQVSSSKIPVKEPASNDLLDTKIKSKRLIHSHRKLKPSNPSRYGMVLKTGVIRPESQEQWNEDIGKKVLVTMYGADIDTRKKIYATIDESPERTEEKIKQIDEIIKECDAKLAENPQDLKAKARKERLMMLKAIAKSVMQEKL